MCRDQLDHDRNPYRVDRSQADLIDLGIIDDLDPKYTASKARGKPFIHREFG